MGMLFTNTLNYDTTGRKRRKKAPKGEVYTKYKPKFVPMEASSGSFRRDSGVQYKSADMTKADQHAARTESLKYTGALVKGIATMHKSNAVPVIDQTQATEISQMRRS